MDERVTIEVTKATADAMAIIDILNSCGAITVSDEVKGVCTLWQMLSASDRAFCTGLMKGALTAMAKGINQDER